MVHARRGDLYVLNDNIERAIMAALRAWINAGGNSRAVEFISARDAATVNASMEVRQFALRPIRVACHLSLVSFQRPASKASGIVFDA
jgi:hypothetical protein